MGPSRVFRRVFDANSLAALGYCEHAETVFTSVPMTVTANCYKEIQSGKDNREKSFPYRNGAETAYEYVNDHESNENIVLYPAPGSPPYNANNAGEKSIRIAFFTRPEAFDSVVGYDDDLGPVLERVREQGIDVEVMPPNEPLYLLHRKGRLTKEEFCTTTQNIIDDQGWNDSDNVDNFWRFPVDCRRFRR